MGRLTKKIHRQPAHSVNAPPTSGPIATAAPTVAPQIPNAVPRSLPWNSWDKRARETANMIAPPIPCAPRARFRNRGLEAAPQAAEATVNRTTPVRKTRLRPSRSPSEPALRTTVASVSEYASTTHCRSVKELWRSRWIFGSATLTTVMSSRSMKMATQTMTSVLHFRSIAATVTEKDSAVSAGMVSDYGARAFASAPQWPGADGTRSSVARVIAFANQKGGVAKTTSTLNLGVALAEKGKRVLAVDLDPQGNLTM